MNVHASLSISRAIMWFAQFTFWLIVIGLLAFAVSGCSFLGIATTDDVNKQAAELERFAEEVAEAKQAQTEAAIVLGFRSFDVLYPGIGDFVEASFAKSPYRPPNPVKPLPDRDSEFPWLEVVGIVGAAFGVSVPAAVKATNMIRDGRRRSYGEATTVREAVELGQIAPKVPA